MSLFGFANLADFLDVRDENDDVREGEEDEQKREWRKITFQVKARGYELMKPRDNSADDVHGDDATKEGAGDNKR